MKCERVQNWLENHGEEPLSQEWQELLIHSKGCFDCSLILKNRAGMFEAMKNLPPPEIPADLRQKISISIDLVKPEEDVDVKPSFVDNMVDFIIKPVQIALSIACLMMIVSIVNLRESPTKVGSPANIARIALKKPQTKPFKKSRFEPEDQLVKVTREDISDFMKKLQEYQRMHPEMNVSAQPVMPGELAVFGQTP